MPTKKDTNEFDVNLAFEYYKQQREEMMELGRQSLAISFQVLAFLVTLSAAFWEVGKPDYNMQNSTLHIVRIAIAIFVASVGAIGLYLNINIEKTRQGHMARARAARKSIAIIEKFASASKEFGRTHIFYYFICVVAIIIGVLMCFLAFAL